MNSLKYYLRNITTLKTKEIYIIKNLKINQKINFNKMKFIYQKHV